MATFVSILHIKRYLEIMINLIPRFSTRSGSEGYINNPCDINIHNLAVKCPSYTFCCFCVCYEKFVFIVALLLPVGLQDKPCRRKSIKIVSLTTTNFVTQLLWCYLQGKVLLNTYYVYKKDTILW